MSGRSNTTTDHETIRRWAESRGGRPVAARGTASTGSPGRAFPCLNHPLGPQPHVLDIDLAGAPPDERLEPIPWDVFFERFEERRLAFLYREEQDDGTESTFFRLVERRPSAG